MAASFRAAIAKVEGPEFDERVGLTVRRPQPARVEKEIDAAFSGFDYDRQIGRIVRALARRLRSHVADAEDATHDVLAELLEKHGERLREDPETWMGWLYKSAYYRLIKIKSDLEPVESIEWLTELAGDAPFDGAQSCVPPSLEAEQDCRHEQVPGDGEDWARAQTIGALQRFGDYYARPPRLAECKWINGLPGDAIIYRQFGSLANAVLAAGMVPDAFARRRKRWKPFEAAKSCLSFRLRNGYWPDRIDVERNRGVLPSASVLIRCFGGTRSGEVQQGAEAILSGSEGEVA
jgi:hypothetical protein